MPDGEELNGLFPGRAGDGRRTPPGPTAEAGPVGRGGAGAPAGVLVEVPSARATGVSGTPAGDPVGAPATGALGTVPVGPTGAGVDTTDGAVGAGPFGVGPAGVGVAGVAVVVEDGRGAGATAGTGVTTAGVVPTAGEGCLRVGAGGATGAAAGAPAAAGRFSRNLRTTGASMVEDADRTNSPRSASLARTALLSYPSSLANS